MKVMVRTAAVLFLAGCLLSLGAATAGAGEFCPAGGVMVKVAVDQDKAVEFMESERRAFAVSEDDGWQLTTFSEASEKIALVVGGDFLFFGIADDDTDEVSERKMNKAFGNDLDYLKNAVQKEVKALWQAEVIEIQGSDVSAIADAVGLGTLASDGGDWALEAGDCEGMTVNTETIED